MQAAQPARGRFISVEGVDGAGKSTQLQWIAEWLSQHGIDFVLTREPGGTPLGEQLRTLVLSTGMDIETEALLMFAGRREHIAQVIEPALAAGRWVLSDRFTDASYAYQGGGRGLPVARLAALEHWVQGPPGAMLQPDLTFLFDVPPDVSQARMAQSRVELDRFEREASSFHERVRDAYLARAAADPQRMRVINAARPIGEIQQEVAALLQGWVSGQAA